MPESLSALRLRLVGQTKEAVQTMLGRPATIDYWTTPQPPQNASAAMLEEFRSRTLDEIWIYPAGRVHFSLAGRVAKVDDKAARYFPPNLV
ncbi:hypothetical protein ACWEOO_26150 [Kribbella sp. NPDC004138]